MSTTEIVRIPVDDSEFQKFAAAFADYQDKLKAQPAAWQATNSRITEFARLQQAAGVSADKAWANATKSAQDYERAVKSATKAQGSLGSSIGNAAAAMKKMATESKAVASHLFGAVKFATKLATFGLGGSLIGASLGLFGLDELANNVLSTTRTARGLGISSGQLNSFRVNMQRIAGTNVLQGAAEAQIDQRRWGYLATLGISPAQAQGESATALAQQEIMAVHRAWKQNPTLASAQAQSALQLGFTSEDIRRIGLTPAASLRAAGLATARDAGALGWSNQVAREWSAFSIQMQKAGKLIETALINTLTPLTPQLTKLSKEIADMIVGLEKSGTVKKWVSDLADGLKAAAEYLGSPAFKQDMRQVAADFQWLAKKLSWVFPAAPAAPGVNNPGNLKDASGHFMGFKSQSEGIRAMFGREERYPTEYGTKTAAQVFAKYKGPWSGPGDMTTKQYVDFIAKRAGINPDAPLPYTDLKKMAAVLHWQTVAEGHPVAENAIYADLMSPGRTVPNNIITRGLGTAGHHADIPNYVAIHDAAVKRATAAAAAESGGKSAGCSTYQPSGGDLSTVLKKLRRQYAPTPARITITNNTAAQVHMSANAAAP